MADPEIETILDQYERELRYFAMTRDDLAPLMEEVIAASERFFADRRDDTARGTARTARQRYVERLAGLEPMIQEWLRIRGSGFRLWEGAPMMTDEQYQRFQGLLAREAVMADGRSDFDALSEQLRTRLLLLEELTG
ncbi:MAG: hypothetical protein ACSLFM_01905 [Tepidiformaceae bacterium]